MTIRPFHIDVPQQELDDLRDRLRRTRYFTGGPDSWDLGTPATYLTELVTYWAETFDWYAAESALNAMPQFQADIDDVRLHFVHVKGAGPAPLPLLFTHGWPGSFWEVHKIIGPLTDPAAHGGDPADAFDVVAPSLPGYGFSSHPGRPGVGPAAIAGLFDRLLTEVLGYPRYVAQGGDWGATVTSALGRHEGASVAAIHLNMFVPTVPLTADDAEYTEPIKRWREEEGGYGHIQGTKPQTLAHALVDSPAGTAAWIVEKFRTWSDCGGDVESVFSKDDLLTNIMLYWLGGTIGTSVRLYQEARHESRRPGPVTVPTAFAAFPKEISSAPRDVIGRHYNLQHYTKFQRGGHFAALEQPEALVADIREAFRPYRSTTD
jgi:pimeloyl-ACP methyl ester carboxylesterase